MMWKPTKPGVYCNNGVAIKLGKTSILFLDSSPGMSSSGCDPFEEWVENYAPEWSLLTPDWQPGAPTVAQLGRWQWWALQYDDCLVVVTTLADEDFDTVECSAPVQFDLSNGPLWVPLEVANGTIH